MLPAAAPSVNAAAVLNTPPRRRVSFIPQPSLLRPTTMLETRFPPRPVSGAHSEEMRRGLPDAAEALQRPRGDLAGAQDDRLHVTRRAVAATQQPAGLPQRVTGFAERSLSLRQDRVEPPQGIPAPPSGRQHAHGQRDGAGGDDDEQGTIEGGIHHPTTCLPRRMAGLRFITLKIRL